jgi:hypothetical protein
MRLSDMKTGTRVRTSRTIDIFPLGKFGLGLAGTVVFENVIADFSQPALSVKLDAYFAELKPWHNELQVFPEGGGGSCTPDDFELIDA